MRKAYHASYYAANADKLKALEKERYKLRRGDKLEKARVQYEALKRAAYAAYGGSVCVCCGETEPMFLCLDHVANDGAAHRKKIGGAFNLYKWLARNGYPPGLLQVMCFNCNNGKKLNGGTCPHRALPSEQTGA